jgi:hypothetical protein
MYVLYRHYRHLEVEIHVQATLTYGHKARKRHGMTRLQGEQENPNGMPGESIRV